VSDDWQKLFQQAQATADSKSFFHWKLEFPEVFIDLEKRDWSEDGGFDAVAGNPPWVDVQEIDQEQKPYMRSVFLAAQGKYDLYAPFIERSLNLIISNGRQCLIVQSKF